MKIAVESATRGVEAANEWADASLQHAAPAMRALHEEAVGYERTYWAFYGLQSAGEEYKAVLAGEITATPQEATILKAELRWYRGMLHTSARRISRMVTREFELEDTSDQTTEQAAYLGLQASRLVMLSLGTPPEPPKIMVEVSRAAEHS